MSQGTDIAKPRGMLGLPMAADYAIRTAATGACAYHGYRRNDSVGWAIGWALLGGVFPVIAVPVALAQGFGRPKK